MYITRDRTGDGGSEGETRDRSERRNGKRRRRNVPIPPRGIPGDPGRGDRSYGNPWDRGWGSGRRGPVPGNPGRREASFPLGRCPRKNGVRKKAHLTASEKAPTGGPRRSSESTNRSRGRSRYPSSPHGGSSLILRDNRCPPRLRRPPLGTTDSESTRRSSPHSTPGPHRPPFPPEKNLSRFGSRTSVGGDEGNHDDDVGGSGRRGGRPVCRAGSGTCDRTNLGGSFSSSRLGNRTPSRTPRTRGNAGRCSGTMARTYCLRHLSATDAPPAGYGHLGREGLGFPNGRANSNAAVSRRLSPSTSIDRRHSSHDFNPSRPTSDPSSNGHIYFRF